MRSLTPPPPPRTNFLICFPDGNIWDLKVDNTPVCRLTECRSPCILRISYSSHTTTSTCSVPGPAPFYLLYPRTLVNRTQRCKRGSRNFLKRGCSLPRLIFPPIGFRKGGCRPKMAIMSFQGIKFSGQRWGHRGCHFTPPLNPPTMMYACTDCPPNDMSTSAADRYSLWSGNLAPGRYWILLYIVLMNCQYSQVSVVLSLLMSCKYFRIKLE